MALTKFNFNSFDLTTAASTGLGFNSSANGFSTIDSTSIVLIKTLTASSSATLSFVDGSSDVVLDNTYPVYMFKFINCHPSASSYLTFQASTDSGSNYNTTCTSTIFSAYHDEADSATALGYSTSRDAAQSTSFIPLQIDATHNDNDSSWSGTLHLFNPSDTTFVKHFLYRDNHYGNAYSFSVFTAGYFNTTSAVDAVQFKMSSGNIDAGTIKLYGIKDS